MSDEIKVPIEAQDVAREVLDFVREIMDITKPLAPLGDEAVGIALDWVRYWRYKNALEIRDRVHDLHSKKGITSTVPIPARLGIPLLDAASMEDDPTLQEMWAGLIANATDPHKRQEAKKVFMLILSSLEPVDVLVLRYLNQHGDWDAESNKEGKRIAYEDVAVGLGVPASEIELALDNLARVGCLRASDASVLKLEDPPGSRQTTGRTTTPAIMSERGEYHATTLGVQLLKACEP